MKTRLINLALVLILTLTLFVPNHSVQAASGPSIKSVYFYLYHYNGPLYVDIKAYCPSNAFVNVDGWDYADRGALNGTWRVWLKDLKPGKTYMVDVACTGPKSYVYWDFKVWYSGSTLKVTRK